MSEPKWDLAKLDSGARSALKRSAGIMLGQDLRAIQAFWQAVGFVPKGSEDKWFACICMESLWKPEDVRQTLPFEELLRRWYQSSETSDSLKNRIVALLDLPWGQDGYLLGKLCNFARQMRAKDAAVMPDFERLADDLARWNSAGRAVQRRWIRTICGQRSEEDEPANTEKEETENAD